MDISVTVSGPLFARGGGLIQSATARAVQALAELGEERLAETLRFRPAGVYLSFAEAKKGKASTGHYRRSQHAIRRGLNAVLDDGDVEYGPWLEGVSSRNQRTRFKGYHAFRRTGQWLQKQAPGVLSKTLTRVLNSANPAGPSRHEYRNGHWT